MVFEKIKFGAAEILEIAAFAGYFVGMTLLFILWRPGSWGWGFLIHALTLFSLGSLLFSHAISGARLRRPTSLPEILLFAAFLYQALNAFLSQVPYASFETLPFFLDGLILFYMGTILFARRREGFISMTLIFMAAMASILIFTEYGNLWNYPISPGAVYRGRKMLIAATLEFPFWGCGSGTLPLLSARYLPLGDRFPPDLEPVFARFLAEHGFIGTSIWIIALASVVCSMFRKQGDANSGEKSKTICFWFAVILAGVFLSTGFFYLRLSLPVILYGFLPLCGMAFILRRGSDESAPKQDAHFQKPGLGYALGILTPILCALILVLAPWVASSLVRIRGISELGTKAFERRLDLARFLAPGNPEIRLAQAKHFRAKASANPEASILPIELAYLRALQKNPYNERYYLEYAHFLDLVRDHSGMVSTLEQGTLRCPGSAEIRMLLFRGYMKTGNRRQALDALNSLRRYYPLDYASHERLARYYAEAAALGASREARILAMQLHPKFYNNHSKE